jgi:hypothetical protein
MTGHIHDECAHDAKNSADANVLPDIHIELYPIELDYTTELFGRIGDTDTFYAPVELVLFNSDAAALHYFMAFSKFVQRVAERIFTVPDGRPCKRWLAENCPEATFENWAWIMFQSSASKRAFEAELSVEASNDLLAYLARPSRQ